MFEVGAKYKSRNTGRIYTCTEKLPDYYRLVMEDTNLSITVHNGPDFTKIEEPMKFEVGRKYKSEESGNISVCLYTDDKATLMRAEVSGTTFLVRNDVYTLLTTFKDLQIGQKFTIGGGNTEFIKIIDATDGLYYAIANNWLYSFVENQIVNPL